ncbi:c-type cytochrome [Sinorhizobium sp. NFACC03]|jgi:cytochrome c553|uniref:c-type cytochrome n=1 Tax=Sinorhizobium sp. NFACC03 TaxID=1566295 RepID=UPI00088C9010|nr:c-type cytochrome [Sinorhizobium sp. NFACC03]SDA99752.1 Cytochrome c553 [Sinorhizobium sp. NFACC03]
MSAKSRGVAVRRCKEVASDFGLVLGLWLSALLVPGGAIAADASQGAQIAATCASCHDPGGRGHAIPPVTSLDEQTIIRLMHNYRSSEGVSPVMHAVALSLSEEELVAVARHLASKAGNRGSP